MFAPLQVFLGSAASCPAGACRPAVFRFCPNVFCAGWECDTAFSVARGFRYRIRRRRRPRSLHVPCRNLFSHHKENDIRAVEVGVFGISAVNAYRFGLPGIYLAFTPFASAHGEWISVPQKSGCSRLPFVSPYYASRGEACPPLYTQAPLHAS